METLAVSPGKYHWGSRKGHRPSGRGEVGLKYEVGLLRKPNVTLMTKV